MKRIEKLEF